MKKVKYKILLTVIQIIAAVIALFVIWSENFSRLQNYLIGLGYLVIVVIVIVLGHIKKDEFN